MHKMLRLATLLAMLLPWPGLAAEPPAFAPVTVHMDYTGGAFGLNVMQLQAAVAMDAAGYRIDVTFHTVGLLAFFVHSEQHIVVWGVWRDDRAEPVRFWSWGHLRGAPRETLIDYEGGQPLIRRLTPPDEADREPVSEAERGDSIDTLSAIAYLVRHVAETGACDGHTRVFDGRRVSEIEARTVGPAMVARGEGGGFQGQTLRCDFAGQQLAGFMHDDGLAWQRRAHHGSAWIAKVVPGGPPIPVRLIFETRWVGDVAMTLTDAGLGPLPDESR
jgi:hypothetical protein